MELHVKKYVYWKAGEIYKHAVEYFNADINIFDQSKISLQYVLTHSVVDLHVQEM